MNIARITAIEARIAEIDRQLAIANPGYRELSRALPSSLADVQQDLAADEALVLFLDTPALPPIPGETSFGL